MRRALSSIATPRALPGPGPRQGSFRLVFNGLAMSESERGAEPCRPLATTRRRSPRPKEEYVTALKKGNYMLKYGRRGQPHKAHFVLSEDLKSLSWTSRRGKGGNDRKEIRLQDVYAIEAGQGTEVFKRFPHHEQLKSTSFSLLYRNKRGEKRSLDIVCSNEDEYELWFTGLTYFHAALLAQDKQQINLPASRVQTNPLAKPSADTNTSKQVEKAPEARRAMGNATPKKDLIGDVYIWGAPSGTVASGRAAHNASSAEGLQQSWVPTLVHDTFRLDVAAVACGPRHAAMITKNGEAYTWGCGHAGRLGHGDCQPSTHPKMVLDLSGKGVVQVACGDWHTAAVTRDGCLYTWGDNNAGILGHGTPHRQWAPKRVERPLEGVTITLVTSGPYHTAAVASNGNLYAWGDGFGGKLGHGGHDTCLVPRKVEALAEWRVTHAAAGVWHTACVTISREASSGNLQQPQLRPESGGETSTASSKDQKDANDAAASTQGKARKSRGPRGIVWTWGGGDKGCLGVGDEEGRMYPEQVARGPESVRQVAAGLHFTLMLSAGGKVWQTGATCASGYDGKALPTWECSDVPMRVKGALGGLITTQIAAGMHHVAVIAGPPSNMASHIYTWGRGTEGQLGHGTALPGTSPNCPEPTLLKHLEGRKFLQVACGGCNTMAVVEHDASLVLKDYETVTKELDELLPKKHAAPPAGLLLGPNPGMIGSPSEGGHTFRPSLGGRRSRHGSMIGDMAHSIASSLSMSRASKADSDCGASVAGTSRAGPGWAAGPSSLPPSGTLGGPPAVFTCPITKEIFEDPVVAADGFTYERSAIIQWLRTSSQSPMTNMPLDHLSLTPSHAVRSAIVEWKEWKAMRDGTPAGGRHRYANSFGGSSQGSLSSYVLRQSGHAGTAVSQSRDESSRLTPRTRVSSNMEPSRGLGSRL